MRDESASLLVSCVGFDPTGITSFCGIAMDRHEEIGFRCVHACRSSSSDIVRSSSLSGDHNADPLPCQRWAYEVRNFKRHVFFAKTGRPDGARIASAVTGIERNF